MHAQSNTPNRPRRLPLARRYALLLEALPTIERLAHRYAYTYDLHTLEADDLAQVGCLEALEAMHKGRKGDNMVAYLVGVARFAMLRYCGQHRSLITTPRKAQGYYEPLAVLSLDAPLSDASDQTLLDVLAADDGDDDAYTAAYDAYLDSLPC
jgi:DNA-directed RNA polymerase specialized sigma24 family protein